MESIHVNFDELPKMTSDQISSDPAPECQTMALEHDSLSPGRKCHENVSHGDKTVTTLNELDLLFSLMFDELLNGPSQAVSKSSDVPTADESIQRQQHQTTPLNNHTTPAPSCQIPTIAPTVISNENINQAETHAENDQVADDEFINIFSTPDHAGCLDSRKSTSGGIQFLGGDKLISWSSKKQECTSMSSAEAEYVSISACFAQAAIAISYNPVQHSRTKHIDVRYHFINEKVEKGIVELFFIGTEYQLANLFTKALPVERFQYLVRQLGMRCLTPAELEALANEPA
nr:retrovirus-related Pol polyprotein from transposon TNT 1-94 [Tanacetum cinerariifolium]